MFENVYFLIEIWVAFGCVGCVFECDCSFMLRETRLFLGCTFETKTITLDMFCEFVICLVNNINCFDFDKIIRILDQMNFASLMYRGLMLFPYTMIH